MIAGSNPDVSIDVFSCLTVSVDMYSKLNSISPIYCDTSIIKCFTCTTETAKKEKISLDVSGFEPAIIRFEDEHSTVVPREPELFRAKKYGCV